MSRWAMAVVAAATMLAAACTSSTTPSPSAADRAAGSTAPATDSAIPCTDEAFAAALESAPADSGIDPKDLKVSSAKCVEGWAYVDLTAPDAEFQALFEYANDPTDPGGTWVFLTSDEPLPVSEMVQHGVPRDVAEQLCPGC